MEELLKEKYKLKKYGLNVFFSFYLSRIIPKKVHLGILSKIDLRCHPDFSMQNLCIIQISHNKVSSFKKGKPISELEYIPEFQ